MWLSLLITSASVAGAIAEYVPGKVFDRFITIWLENQDFDVVQNNGHIQALAKRGILLTNYYGHTHPSQPNYISSIGGDYFGMNHDSYAKIPENVSTVVDLLDGHSIGWKGYFEGIPGPGYMGEGSTAEDKSGWDYVRKHNPFLTYDSIALNGSRLAQIQSFTDFESDIKKQSLPQYAHLSPNMLNDGHNTTLEYAAAWTESFLTPLLSNKYFMNNTLVLLTYDESATYEKPNKIVSVLLGGAIPKDLQGTKDDTFYTHYSILSSLENNWELPCLGRYDVGANVFSLLAQKTGYVNKNPPNIATIDSSISYPGALNDEEGMWKEIPAPNLKLIGAGGKGIETTVKVNWDSQMNEGKETPYDGSGVVFDGREGSWPIYKEMAPEVSSG